MSPVPLYFIMEMNVLEKLLFCVFSYLCHDAFLVYWSSVFLLLLGKHYNLHSICLYGSFFLSFVWVATSSVLMILLGKPYNFLYVCLDGSFFLRFVWVFFAISMIRQIKFWIKFVVKWGLMLIWLDLLMFHVSLHVMFDKLR